MAYPNFFVTAVALFIIGGAHAGAFAADAAKPTSFAVPGHGDLQLLIPSGWKESIESWSRPGFPSMIQFATEGEKFNVMVFLDAPRAGELTAPERLRIITDSEGRKLLSRNLRTAITFEEVKGPAATGYFFMLTEKAPEPGLYEYHTVGYMAVGDLFLTVVICHHQKDAPERETALGMFKAASQKPGPKPAP